MQKKKTIAERLDSWAVKIGLSVSPQGWAFDDEGWLPEQIRSKFINQEGQIIRLKHELYVLQESMKQDARTHNRVE